MNQKITGLQAGAMIINMIVPSALLIIPSHIIELTRQDEWLSIILAIAFTLVFAWVIGMICRQFSGRSVLEWLQGRIGLWAAKLLGLVLCFYYLIVASTIVRQYSDYVWEQMLMKTPTIVICFVIAAVSVYMACRGVEAIGRVQFIIFVIYISFVVINLFILFPKYNLNEFKPLFEAPPLQHAFASLMPAGWLSSVASVVLLLPHLKKPEQGMKVALWSTIVAGMMLLLITSVAVAVFGADIIDSIAYPAFAALGTIDIGQFLERVDVLLLTAWMACMFGNVSASLFFLFELLKDTLKLNSGPSMSFAIVLIVTVTAVYSWPNNSAVVYFSNGILSFLLLGSNYMTYVLLWAGLLLTKGKRRKSH